MTDECLDIARQVPDILEVREPFWRRFGGRVPTDSLEVVGESYAMFWIAKGDPKQCMIGGASLGRDADCVASIAGAIAGAYRDIDAIPMEWVQTCDDATLSDPHELIDMTIEEMSEALYRVLLSIVRERNSRSPAKTQGKAEQDESCSTSPAVRTQRRAGRVSLRRAAVPLQVSGYGRS